MTAASTIAAMRPPAIPAATSSAPWRGPLIVIPAGQPDLVGRRARFPWPSQFVTGTAWATTDLMAVDVGAWFVHAPE
jgi:hypothetical protein